MMSPTITFLRTLTHSQMNTILDKYLEMEYILNNQPVIRLYYLRVILRYCKGKSETPSRTITKEECYNLWSDICKVAFDIYVAYYFGKPVTQQMYIGVVKLTDILIRYTVDGLHNTP